MQIYFLKKRIFPSICALKKIIKLKPEIVLTDYAAYPSLYAKLYSILKLKRIPLLVWLLGDFWTEYFAYFPKAKLSVRLVGMAY
jgi:hypothetical protein